MRTRQEFLLVGDHLFDLLLAHGAAHHVRFAQGEAADLVKDLDDLFLVDDDAVGLFQNLLELREIVGDLALARAAGDVIVDHAALNRSGTVKGIQRRQVGEAMGFDAAQDIGHAATFKLEDARRQAFAKQFIGSGVVERERFEVQLFPSRFFDELHAVVNGGERGEPEKIHFQQTDFLQVVHRILGRDFILVALVKRDDFLQRLRGDDHARCVR